jgi:hypothetical protein
MPEVVSPPSLTLESLLAPGIAAVKKYWRPFLLLQSVALLLVILYYTNSHIKTICDQLSRFKESGGLIFTAVAAAVAGALLPELAKAVMMGDRAITRNRVRDVGFAMAAFAVSGHTVHHRGAEDAVRPVCHNTDLWNAVLGGGLSVSGGAVPFAGSPAAAFTAVVCEARLAVAASGLVFLDADGSADLFAAGRVAVLPVLPGGGGVEPADDIHRHSRGGQERRGRIEDRESRLLRGVVALAATGGC